MSESEAHVQSLCPLWQHEYHVKARLSVVLEAKFLWASASQPVNSRDRAGKKTLVDTSCSMNFWAVSWSFKLNMLRRTGTEWALYFPTQHQNFPEEGCGHGWAGSQAAWLRVQFMLSLLFLPSYEALRVEGRCLPYTSSSPIIPMRKGKTER